MKRKKKQLTWSSRKQRWDWQDRCCLSRRCLQFGRWCKSFDCRRGWTLFVHPDHHWLPQLKIWGFFYVGKWCFHCYLSPVAFGQHFPPWQSPGSQYAECCCLQNLQKLFQLGPWRDLKRDKLWSLSKVCVMHNFGQLKCTLMKVSSSRTMNLHSPSCLHS